jgi:hypothetical protein
MDLRMSYHEYKQMIGNDKALPEGVTMKSFDENEHGRQWYGTMYFLHGIPKFMQFYVWSVKDLGAELTRILKEFAGEGYKYGEEYGGQGHYQIAILKDE